jgi:hypothetical protein
MYKNPIQKRRPYARSLGSKYHEFDVSCCTVLWPIHMGMQDFPQVTFQKRYVPFVASNNVIPANQSCPILYLLI